MEFEDLKAVFELGESLFTAENWPILYRHWDEYEIMERFISDGDYCIVAEDDNRIVGFVIGAIIRKRKSRWKYGYIIWMGVHEKYQKKGVGKKLFSKILSRFKEEDVNILMAGTSPDNKKALGFFDKNGFKQREKHLYLFKNISKKKIPLKYKSDKIFP